MKAVVFEEYGGYDVLQYKEVPDPQVGPNEVLVSVKAAACNYNDIWGRRGAPMQVALPHISGSDAAGVIAEVGTEVRSVQVGDEVVVHCGLPASGNREGQEYSIWGYESPALDGALGELCKLPVENVVPKPKNLSFEEAASLPLVLVTAWRQLVYKGGIKPGAYAEGIWGSTPRSPHTHPPKMGGGVGG